MPLRSREAFTLYSELAKGLKDGNINSHWATSESGKNLIQDVTDPNLPMERDENGNLGWPIEGKFTTLSEIREIIESKQVDTGFQTGIQAIVDEQKAVARKR